MYCDLWGSTKYIKVRKLFKGGNYSRTETIWGNTVYIIGLWAVLAMQHATSCPIFIIFYIYSWSGVITFEFSIFPTTFPWFNQIWTLDVIDISNIDISWCPTSKKTIEKVLWHLPRWITVKSRVLTHVYNMEINF